MQIGFASCREVVRKVYDKETARVNEWTCWDLEGEEEEGRTKGDQSLMSSETLQSSKLPSGR